MNQLAWIEPAA